MQRTFALVLLTASNVAYAADINGVWQTEHGSSGGYLEVTIGPCESDAAKTCGVITSAYTPQGPDPDYKNLGKLIIADMATTDGENFSGGTVWDPQKDKHYKSTLQLKGDELDVEGCVSIVCKGQDWIRVKQTDG